MTRNMIAALLTVAVTVFVISAIASSVFARMRGSIRPPISATISLEEQASVYALWIDRVDVPDGCDLVILVRWTNSRSDAVRDHEAVARNVMLSRFSFARGVRVRSEPSSLVGGRPLYEIRCESAETKQTSFINGVAICPLYDLQRASGGIPK